MKELLLRSVVLWLLFVPVAVMNGAVREKTYKPRIGDLAAHQVSTVIAICLFLILASIMLWSFAEMSYVALWLAGGLMVALTLAFEFGAGHYLFKNPWSKLLHDYNLRRGRIWILFLLAVLTSPPLVKLLAESAP